MISLKIFRSPQLARQRNAALGVLPQHVAFYSSESQRPLKTTNLAAMKRGTGGRSSFNGMVATVFGASGFVGRYVCNKLGKIGTQLIIPYRGEFYDVLRLKLCGDLGQVLFHPFHLNDENSIRAAVKYSNVVINLVGRDFETKNFKFNDVHVEGARRIARICRESGVDRLIYLSALNIEPNPPGHILKSGSNFLSSKYAGEGAVLEEFPQVTIIRPADIFGGDDRFLRFYAHHWRRQFRCMPLWQKGERTVKQPVYVSDVAQAIVNCAKDPDTAGKIYQAVGPKRYKLGELVDWLHRIMRKDRDWWGYRRYDMRLDPTFLLKAKFNELISPKTPLAGLHLERLERECITDKVLKGVPTLEDLGIQLMNLEDQAPWELRPFRAVLYYDAELGEFESPPPLKSIDPREEIKLGL